MLDGILRDRLASSACADDRALAREAGELAERSGLVMRIALARLSLEDRMLIRMRFGTSMTIAAISRVMQLPQRPLYRRIGRLLLQLRRALAGAGFDGSMVGELAGRPATEMNFGQGAASLPGPFTSGEAGAPPVRGGRLSGRRVPR